MLVNKFSKTSSWVKNDYGSIHKLRFFVVFIYWVLQDFHLFQKQLFGLYESSSRYAQKTRVTRY